MLCSSSSETEDLVGWYRDDDNWDDNWGDDEFSQVSLGSEDRVLPTSRDEKKINDRFNSNR